MELYSSIVSGILGVIGVVAANSPTAIASYAPAVVVSMIKKYYQVENFNEEIERQLISAIKEAILPTQERLHQNNEAELFQDEAYFIEKTCTDGLCLEDVLNHMQTGLVKLELRLKEKRRFTEWLTDQDIRNISAIYQDEFHKIVASKYPKLGYYMSALRLDEHDKSIAKLNQEINRKSEYNSNNLDSMSIDIPDIYSKEKEDYYKFSRRKKEKGTVDNVFLPSIYSFHSVDISLKKEKICLKNTDNRETLMKNILEILNSQRLLLIVGDYGSGKTVLLKAVHKMINEMNNTVSFTSLCQYMFPYIQNNDKKRVFFFWDSLRAEGRKRYIFLDSLDDLNLPSENGKNNCLDTCMDWIVEYLTKRPDCSFIVTSRNYVQINHGKKETIQRDMAENYYIRFDMEQFAFIKTRELKSEEIATWIEEYSKLYKVNISKTGVKERFKRIINSLKNPLFLFIFMESCIQNGIHDNKQYYCYYQEFIEQTIEGKYYFETYNAAYVLQEEKFVRQYQELLEYIAFDILQNNNKDINELGDELWEKEVLLGERLSNRNYYLRMSQFSTVTANKLNQMWENHQELKDANLLNCYFIAKEGDLLFFRDVNILFLLASNRIYKNLWEIIEKNNDGFKLDDLGEIQMIDFYPQLLDFMLYQIQVDGRQDEFFRYAYYAVREENLQNKFVLLKNDNPDIIAKILLLYIIFIKFNRNNYQAEELRHIIKDMIHYNKLYKNLRYLKQGTSKYIYSIERYFMGINLIGAEVRRLNLKYYNFQGTTISDTVFKQCQFYDNNFQKVKTKDVKFEMCDIKKLKLNADRGSQEVKINDCYLSDSELSGLKKLSIKDCRLQDVTISVYARDEVILENCIVYSLYIKSLGSGNSGIVKFNNCIFKSQIALKEMKGKIEIAGKCIKVSADNLFKNQENVSISGSENIL